METNRSQIIIISLCILILICLGIILFSHDNMHECKCRNNMKARCDILDSYNGTIDALCVRVNIPNLKCKTGWVKIYGG